MAVTTINWNGAPGSVPDANSCQITYAAGDLIHSLTAETFPVGAVSTAIRDFLVSRGWTYLPATQPAGRYAFTAPNLLDSAGTPSTKFIIIDMATSARLFIKVYESVSGAGVLLNLAPRSDLAWAIMATKDASAISSASGKLWLGASARHIVMHSNTGSVYGNQLAMYGDNGPIGGFELTRPHALDLAAGIPKFGHINGTMGYQSTATPLALSLPRSLTGTGVDAGLGVVTMFGHGGTLNGVNARVDTHMPLFVDVLTGKANASSMQAVSSGSTASSTALAGTLMNYVAVTRNYGLIIGDDIQLPMKLDPLYGNAKFFDPTGTLENYWLLGGNLLGQWRFAVPK